MTYVEVYVEPWSAMWLLLALIPVVICCGIGGLVKAKDSGMWIGIGVFAGIMSLIIVSAVGIPHHDSKARVAALEGIGYSNIHVEGREFSGADSFGDYAEGLIIPKGRYDDMSIVIRTDRIPVEE